MKVSCLKKLLFLGIALLFRSIYSQKNPSRQECEFDKRQREIFVENLTENIDKARFRDRILDNDVSGALEWRKMRVTLDISLVDAYLLAHPDRQELWNFVHTVLIGVKSYLEERLEVFSYETLKYGAMGIDNCKGEIIIPEMYKTDLQTDLIVFIQPVDLVEATYFAAASSCKEYRNRPIMGSLTLNWPKIENTDMNSYHYVPIFIHEFFHILGFDERIFKQ